MKNVLVCLLTVTANIGICQPLFLYKTPEPNGKYVLTRNYQEGERTISEAFISDGLSIAMTTNPGVARLDMTNTYVFRTRYSATPSIIRITNAVQDKMFVQHFRLDVPYWTPLAFNNRVAPISDASFGTEAHTNSVGIIDEPALRALKKMGRKPPADIEGRNH